MGYCLALDMPSDAALIAEYEEWHKAIWPEIRKSILDSGITNMEIYRLENRLFMIMEVGPDFSWERKAAMDAANPVVQRWEELMWKYQVAIPGGRPGEKWRLMDKIFSLQEAPEGTRPGTSIAKSRNEGSNSVGS
ncbi:MAG: L-rhamnose mutarotase [Bacteroidetes bacterium]|nr:L-rhamnose mutarotase [Bacteroidota bacterium]